LTHFIPIYQLDIFDLQLTEDSEVFEDGAIGETPGGGSIGTYKELCNIANEMGQPDLIYKFMDLANYQTSLNSRRGAAFGFSRIAKQAGDALKPHLQTLVPKLFRYQYDPNKRIQVGCQKKILFFHTTVSCVELNLQHLNVAYCYSSIFMVQLNEWVGSRCSDLLYGCSYRAPMCDQPFKTFQCLVDVLYRMRWDTFGNHWLQNLRRQLMSTLTTSWTIS
jgi:hypothetical protein